MAPAVVPPPRSAALRATSRRSLAFFLAFAGVCAGVWFQTAYRNRDEGYDAASDAITGLCGGSPAADAAPRAVAVSSENDIYTHLHVAYTLAIADPAVWTSDPSLPVVRGGIAAPAAHVRATSDLQTVNYVQHPLRTQVEKEKKRGKKKRAGSAEADAAAADSSNDRGGAGVLDLKDLRVGSFRPPSSTPRLDLNLLLYVRGVPTTAAFAEPTCYFQRGWGVVCVVEGRAGGEGEPAARVADFREAEEYLMDVVAAHYPPATAATARAQTCGILLSLQAQLDHLPNLPMPAAVLAPLVAAVDALRAHAHLPALEHAWQAARHPLLLTSTYFPPDHLLAVYLPLFFPIAVTCLVGVANEVKATKRERAAAAAGGK